jgi:hypothetical protein
MASKTEEIISTLPLQKQKYVISKLSGKSSYKAAIAADYAHTTARNPQQIETPDVKQAFAELLRLKIPAKRIVKRISEGLNATDTKFFVVNGIVKDTKETINYKERREYSSIAAQMGNYWHPKQEINTTKTLDDNTAKRLIAMAERLGLEELDWEQRRELRKSHVTLEVQAKEQEFAEDSGEESQNDEE